jgi:beta-glucosidase
MTNHSSIDRRQLIGAASLLSGGLLAAGAKPAAAEIRGTARGQTQPFLWGTAGAAYQIEGANYASDLWLLEHVKPTVFRTPSGDACDTYNRIEEDLDIVRDLGFNAHRFSIEWSRIEPEPGQISRAGLDYYRRVLTLCHDRGLTPVVTLNHWTTPRWFAQAGGFETSEGIAPFVAYCRRVTEHMGDLMGLAATFNEANIGAQLSWIPTFAAMMVRAGPMKAAAAAATNSAQYSSLPFADVSKQQPVMLEAHARAFDAMKSVRPDLPVGVTLSLWDDQPVGEDSAWRRKDAEVWAPWLAAPGDWLGVQTYSRSRVGATSDVGPEPGRETTESGYEFWPEALEAVIRKVATRVAKPIYITENGIGTPDDTRRVEYIRRATAGLLACRADGIDVRGYLHWTLLDNWEWVFGYSRHFGLVAVDSVTFKRTPKPSAAFLGEIARADLGRPRPV